MMLRPVLVLGLAAALAGCASGPSQNRRTFDEITSGDGSTVERVAAAEYFLRLGSPEGPGLTLEEAHSMREWSAALNAESSFSNITERSDRISATVHNRNDLTRLLDFPGWRGRLTFFFDKDGRVREQLYEPLPTTPTFAEAFAPALEWVKASRADRLEGIWVNDQFVYRPEAAREWVAILRQWRAATGRPPVE